MLIEDKKTEYDEYFPNKRLKMSQLDAPVSFTRPTDGPPSKQTPQNPGGSTIVGSLASLGVMSKPSVQPLANRGSTDGIDSCTSTPRKRHQRLRFLEPPKGEKGPQSHRKQQRSARSLAQSGR